MRLVPAALRVSARAVPCRGRPQGQAARKARAKCDYRALLLLGGRGCSPINQYPAGSAFDQPRALKALARGDIYAHGTRHGAVGRNPDRICPARCGPVWCPQRRPCGAWVLARAHLANAAVRHACISGMLYLSTPISTPISNHKHSHTHSHKQP